MENFHILQKKLEALENENLLLKNNIEHLKEAQPFISVIDYEKALQDLEKKLFNYSKENLFLKETVRYYKKIVKTYYENNKE